jgi:hypothetical protein
MEKSRFGRTEIIETGDELSFAVDTLFLTYSIKE